MTRGQTGEVIEFKTLTEAVGKFDLTQENRTLLMPEMNRLGVHLLAAAFRSFGIRARVMETGKGLDLGSGLEPEGGGFTIPMEFLVAKLGGHQRKILPYSGSLRAFRSVLTVNEF